jgi:hypothetical protein
VINILCTSRKSSQIINAAPHERARLKAELKEQLQEDWRRQVRLF